MILEFTNGEDYVAYLKAHQTPTTHLDIGVVSGERNKHGICGVSFYVVATARVKDTIACWARLVHSTTSVDIRYVDQDRPEEEKVRTRVWKAWEQVKAQMEEDGADWDSPLEVQPGKWREDEPRWLR